MQEAQGYLNEAAERIKLATLQVEQMRGYNEQAIGGVGVMNAMIAEMNVYLGNVDGYLQAATGYQDVARVFITESAQYTTNGQAYLESSREQREIGRETMDLAVVLRDEFFQVLRERMGLRRQVSESSAAQPVGAQVNMVMGENTVY